MGKGEECLPCAHSNECKLCEQECSAGDIEHLALSGTNYTDWRQVRWAFVKAVNYRKRERKRRGKRFRDTQDGRRRHRKPLWKRH